MFWLAIQNDTHERGFKRIHTPELLLDCCLPVGKWVWGLFVSGFAFFFFRNKTYYICKKKKLFFSFPIREVK